MLDRWLKTAGCAVLVILLAAPLPASADDDAFTVSGVHEDVTAASALAARDQAQAQGQRNAFDTLMGRIGAGKSPHVSADQLTDLVAGFEVANERTSSVRYVVDYTFHFKPGAIRRLLQDSSVAYVEPARQVLVLPVFSENDRAVLWDDPNPWRDAWAAHSSGQGALPTIVPVGDLADVSTIDAPKAIAGDPAAIKAISARYQNDDVIVLQGKVNADPHRFDVTAARYSSSNPGAPRTTTITTAAKPNETDTDLMNRAVANVVTQLGQSWKAANTFDPNSGGIVNAVVQSGSLADWVAVRNRLRGIASVRATDLVSIDRNQIRVAIHYVGDQDQLRAALRDRNLDLTGSDPDWTLTVGGAAAQPKEDAAPPGSAPETDPVGAPPRSPRPDQTP